MGRSCTLVRDPYTRLGLPESWAGPRDDIIDKEELAECGDRVMWQHMSVLTGGGDLCRWSVGGVHIVGVLLYILWVA
jgi:hypothetical protein